MTLIGSTFLPNAYALIMQLLPSRLHSQRARSSMDRPKGQSGPGIGRPGRGGARVPGSAARDWLTGPPEVAGDFGCIGPSRGSERLVRGAAGVGPGRWAEEPRPQVRSRSRPGEMERQRARALGRDSKAPRRKGLSPAPPSGPHEPGEKRPKLVSVEQSLGVWRLPGPSAPRAPGWQPREGSGELGLFQRARAANGLRSTVTGRGSIPVRDECPAALPEANLKTSSNVDVLTSSGRILHF